MHELSICQALLAQIETLATRHRAQQVVLIKVQIGPLAGVEPHLLTQAFALAQVGTLAAQAKLVLETLPVRVRCQSCDQESETSSNQLICHHCGDWHTELLSGDEMLLASVELMTPDTSR
jgi:hydrogenase nickel incorporation protein HypA/HybF